MRWARFRTFALTMGLATVTACAVYLRPHPGVIYIGVTPPPPYTEVMTAAPGRGFAWMPGHWEWRLREYAWVPGGWIEIPPGYSAYLPGHWAHDPYGWFWIEARWR